MLTLRHEEHFFEQKKSAAGLKPDIRGFLEMK